MTSSLEVSMPLPRKHLASFYDSLARHEQRVAQLREGIRLAEEEAEFHKVLLDFAANERTIAALEELYDRPDLVSELSDDPAGYCRKRNIYLPEGVTLAAVKEEDSPHVTAHLRRGPWDMEIGWDYRKGFFATPPTGPAASLSSRFMSSVEVEPPTAD
jgi:hypothetical protein